LTVSLLWNNGSVGPRVHRAFHARLTISASTSGQWVVGEGISDLETDAIDGFDGGPVKKAFAIPDNELTPMLIAAGHPRRDAPFLPRGFRRPLEDFVSLESYDAGEISRVDP